MENPKITNYDIGGILLGDNHFETGTLTLAAEGTVKEGALLARESTGKFSVVTATSGASAKVPVAVYIGDNLENADDTNPADFAIRALVSGRVRKDRLSVAGNAVTPAESDMLRAYGILPVAITEVNKLDNQ